MWAVSSAGILTVVNVATDWSLCIAIVAQEIVTEIQRVGVFISGLPLGSQAAAMMRVFKQLLGGIFKF